MSNLNRNPANPSVVGAAVQAWLDAEYVQIADAALEAILLEQGVICPDDEAWFEDGAREHGLVHAFLLDGTIIEVTTSGEVSQF